VNRAGVYGAAVAALLGWLAAAQITSALQETQTYDEAIHLAAGYGYLKTGEYRFNVEHPPLGKILAALPLLPLKPHVPLENPGWHGGDQRDFGRAFLYHNHVPADTMLFRARCVTMLVSLFLGVALAFWTRRHFGAGAGLLAMLLYAFDPNITAHGRYVTNDLLMCLFLFLATMAWGAYLVSGKRKDLLWAALALALGLVSKFSALFLVPLFVVLYLIRWWQQRTGFSWRRLAGAMLVVAGVSMAVISLSYWREVKRLTFSYLVGLESAAQHDQVGHFSYLLGQRSETGGWWYYFPVAFAVKTPTAVLILAALSLLLGAGWLLRRPLRDLYRRLRQLRFEWYLLAVPAAGYFVLWMRSHINIGLRHILPVYPFLFVLAAAVVLRGWPQRWRKALPVVLCAVAALEVYESVRIYPHYLAFFNLPAGGPARGPDYLVDSNLDWGQDLKKLKVWHEAHGQPRLCLAYFGQADFTYYGLKVAHDWLPPTWELEERKSLNCIAAVSVTVLKDVYRFPGEFLWLQRMQPFGQVGYSIYLYDLRRQPPGQPRIQ